MRVAVFTDTFLPQVNGVSIGTRDLVDNLKNYEFLIVAPKPKHHLEWKPKNAEFAFASPAIDLPTYKDYKICFFINPRVIEKAGKFRPDVVLVQTPFYLGIAGKNFAKKNKIPVIGYYNTLLPEFLVYLPFPLSTIKHTRFAKNSAWDYGSAFYNQCDLVLSNSNAMLSELRKHGLKARHEKMPYGINPEFFQARKSAKKEKDFKLVFMGRLSFEKNIEVVVKAFALLEKKFPKLRLVLIGNGPARKTLELLALELGVKGKVEFAGVMHGKALAEKLASCDLFVTASTIETQGISTFEALAAGLPAIAADFLANPEAVIDGKNGFLFKPFSEKDCAGKIEKVLKDKMLYKRLAGNAVRFANDYSWQKLAGRFETVFERIAREKKQNN